MNDEQQIIEPVPTLAGYKKIPTFKLWIANQFPYIETDFDAITKYELLQAVIKYLNTIIENENNVESNVTALYNAFVNLHDYVTNYFDNLDVQDEINNKLDKMVDDGTLETIIGQYINPYLEILHKTIIYLSEYREQYPNDNDLLSYALNNNFHIVVNDLDIILDTSFTINNNTTLINEGSILFNNSRGFLLSNKHDITIKGGKIATLNPDSTQADTKQPLVISNSYNITIENVEFSTDSSDGLYLGVAYSESLNEHITENVKIESCKFINCARNGIVINSGIDIFINNCYFENINKYSPGHAIDVEFENRYENDFLYTKNCNITNCYAKNCNTLINIFPTVMMKPSQIGVYNCTCDDCKIIIHGPASTDATEKIDIVIDNITFINYDDQNNAFLIRDFKGPNTLNISNIILKEFTGAIPTIQENSEFGDFLIDGNGRKTENISISNIVYINPNKSRKQTFRYKDTFGAYDTNVNVYNSTILNYLNQSFSFGTKFINCSGYLNESIKGNNGYFRVMKLDEFRKYDFKIFTANIFLHIEINTVANTLNVTKDSVGNTYITQARLTTDSDGNKYLEFNTARVYGFSFWYDLKDIPNGVDKLLAPTPESVLTEVTIS